MSQTILAHSEQVARRVQTMTSEPIAAAQEYREVIDSLLHPAAVLIRQVVTRSGRLQHGLILIDDEENILQALETGVKIHSLYYAGGADLSAEFIRKLSADVRIYEVAKRTCKKLFENDKISRVFAIAYTPAVQPVHCLAAMAGDIVALEDLSISGNIGAIIRTAVAFGVAGIVLLNAEPVDLYDRRIIRASRGHIFSLPVIAIPTDEFICFCRQNNLPILVMATQAQTLVNEAACMPNRLVILFGSEKDGCSQAMMGAATLQVQIPTDSRVESLNVSTAAGIMLYNRLWFNQPGR